MAVNALRGGVPYGPTTELLNATVTTVVFKYRQWVKDDAGGVRRAMECTEGCCSEHPMSMMCQRVTAVNWMCTTSAMYKEYSLGEFHIGTYDANDASRYYVDYAVDGPWCKLSWGSSIALWTFLLLVAFLCALVAPERGGRGRGVVWYGGSGVATHSSVSFS